VFALQSELFEARDDPRRFATRIHHDRRPTLLVA
jgi:hypothetical protein